MLSSRWVACLSVVMLDVDRTTQEVFRTQLGPKLHMLYLLNRASLMDSHIRVLTDTGR